MSPRPDMYFMSVKNELEPYPTKRVSAGISLQKNGRTFPLEIHYKLVKRVLYVWVPIPEGYESKFIEKLRARGINDLAYCQIECRKRDSEHTPKSTEHLGNLNHKYAYLEWFYVRAQQHKDDGGEEEQTAFARFGKRMLCWSLNVLIQNGHITDPENAYVGLEAGGGHCAASKPEEKQKTEEPPKDDIAAVDKFLSQYPFTYEYVLSVIRNMKDVNPEEFKRKTKCEIEDNIKLVKYYEHYGFRVFDPRNGLGFLMEAPLPVVLNSCRSAAGFPNHLEDIQLGRTRARPTLAKPSAPVKNAKRKRPDPPPLPAPPKPVAVAAVRANKPDSAERLRNAVTCLRRSRPGGPLTRAQASCEGIKVPEISFETPESSTAETTSCKLRPKLPPGVPPPPLTRAEARCRGVQVRDV
eukprot:jgi/Mesvir1/10506/Mv04620-RA.1